MSSLKASLAKQPVLDGSNGYKGDSPQIIYAPHEIQEYALAYVERCRGDVPQLEREREVLLAALEQSWRSKQYELVVRLMTGVIYLSGRLNNAELARRLLLRGIYACERIKDQRDHAYFLNRLSALLWSRGEYGQAQRIWRDSLEDALASDQPVYLWEPFCSLVYMVDITGQHNARPLAEKLLRARRNDEPASIATILFMRAFNAHFFGDLDRAYDDLNLCMRHLSTLDDGASFHKPFFEMEVRTELARVQGDYTGSRVYAEAAITLAQTFCDPYTVADLLCDQIWFARWMSKLDDAYLLMVRLIELTKQHGTPHHHAFCTLLSKQFPEALRIPLTSLLKADVGAQFSESLSRSEMDVLRLLAAGLSNREIASSLVIAVGTVKKHVEHIYGKLDAHNRTQAVARARTLGLLH